MVQNPFRSINIAWFICTFVCTCICFTLNSLLTYTFVIYISTEDGNQTQENQSLETTSEVNDLHFAPISEKSPYVNIDNNECNITKLSYRMDWIMQILLVSE